MGAMSSAESTSTPPEPGGGRWRWHWWHRQTTTTRRIIRTSLALLVTGSLSMILGVLTASADSSLGPHAARYSVTAQHEIVLDLGPLGAVLIDSPLPWPLGVDVVVQEIPLELAEVPASPVTGLAGDLAAYAQAVSHPEAVVADAAMALVRDAVGRTVLFWSGMLVAISVGRFSFRGLLRAEVARALRRPGVVPLTAVVVVALVAVPLTDGLRHRPPEGTTIGALADTPFADLRMTGRMAELIDTYGGYLVDAYEENEAFYAQVSANLETAYADNRSPRRPPGIPIVSPEPIDPDTVETDVPEPDAVDPADADADSLDDAAGAGAAADADAAAVTGAQEDSPTPRVEPVTMLMVSDLHCNVGMAEVIATAVRLSGATVLLDGGDTVMSGTSVESYCVNAFAGAIPDEIPIVVSTGNHDSLTTADQMRDAGYHVLDGSVVEFDGIRILGDTDPTLTAVGEGTRPERDESVDEMGARLAQEACAVDRVDLLLIHNPRAALPTMDEGCAPLALSGHWHRRQGPEVHEAGTRYVSASTAGASGGATVGPLGGTAEMTVLRIDAASGRPLDYRVISIEPDTSVHVGRWYSFPTPTPPPPVPSIPTPQTPTPSPAVSEDTDREGSTPGPAQDPPAGLVGTETE